MVKLQCITQCADIAAWAWVVCFIVPKAPAFTEEALALSAQKNTQPSFETWPLTYDQLHSQRTLAR